MERQQPHSKNVANEQMNVTYESGSTSVLLVIVFVFVHVSQRSPLLFRSLPWRLMHFEACAGTHARRGHSVIFPF
jgi:hypothetical protein